RIEARELKGLVETPEDTEPALFTSSTLWCGTGLRGYPALPPFVRYLLLRALAARDPEHPASWTAVFKVLRQRAADQAGQLHHELALGGRASVVAELARLLPCTAAADWLSLLDQVVASPDPRRQLAVGAEPAEPRVGPPDPVARLVRKLHAVADPRLSDRIALRRSYLLITYDSRQLADSPPDDADPDQL